MKHFNEILIDIDNTRKQIKENEAKEKALCDRWMKEENLITRHNIHKELTEEYAKQCELTRDAHIALRLLQNNAKIALFHDILPVILDTLTKYKNKPYGDKTRTKITNEVHDKTGSRAYIDSRYGDDIITVYPDVGYNTHNITIGVKYENGGRKNILIDNKIQIVPVESFELCYINHLYIDDIHAAIIDMKETYRKAVEAQKELETICSNFNKYAVDGIGRIYCDKRIYNNLLVK